MKLKHLNRLLALPILVGMACSAQSDIIVQTQHNYIEAFAPYSDQFDSSDSLTSWNGAVSARGTGSASASLSSTIAAFSITLNGSTSAHSKVSYYEVNAWAHATTHIQFTVSTNRTYTVVGTVGGNVGRLSEVQLLRDGVVISSGKFKRVFPFEVGHTYEIDCSAWGGAGWNSAGYGFSMK